MINEKLNISEKLINEEIKKINAYGERIEEKLKDKKEINTYNELIDEKINNISVEKTETSKN